MLSKRRSPLPGARVAAGGGGEGKDGHESQTSVSTQQAVLGAPNIEHFCTDPCRTRKLRCVFAKNH